MDKELGECLENPGLLERKYGSIRAKIIRRRLDTVRMASSLEQLRAFPGRFHELTGGRKGQWACDVDQPYRMILEQKGEQTIAIIEITNYHGK